MTWRNAIGAAVVCAAAAVEAATPSVALPPFIITGRVIDYLGAGLSSAEVRVRKDGVLLARGSVGDIGADSSANYAVTVPMASTQIATAASQGDTLVLEIDSGAGSFSSTNAVVEAANPGRTLKLDLRAASCTNQYGVADEYLAVLRGYVAAEGITGFFGADGAYLPDADFDGDGVSNYDEYLAGSDPFNAEDAGLRILSWKAVPENPDVMEATFLPGRSRAYSAERAEASAEGVRAFEHRVHQQEKTPGAPAKNYFLTQDEDPEIRAIYLYKEGEGSLYRLRME